MTESHKIYLAIVGSRDLEDYSLLETNTSEYIAEIKAELKTETEAETDEATVEFIIVSGGAKGADTLAEKYAVQHGYQTLIFRVTQHDWKDLGNAAGPLRNSKIVKASDFMIAFPSKSSRGTFDSINKMKKKNNQIKVVKYDA